MTKTFEALASGDTLEIRIYGAIGASLFFSGATAQSVSDAIKFTPHKRIVVKINSPGGDAFEGMAIRAILASQEVETVAEIEGRAASAGSIAAMGCKTIRMFTGSAMMIHEASGMPAGPLDSRGVKKLASALETLNDGMAEVYAARTGLSKKKCREMMADETWLSASAAVKQKFADEVVNEKREDALKVAASFDWQLFGYAPPRLVADDDDGTDEVPPPAADDDNEEEAPKEPKRISADVPTSPLPTVPPEQVPPQSAASAEASAARTRLDTMTIKLIAQAVGLQADADESAVVAAVSQLHSFANELRQLTKAGSNEAVLGAIRGLQATAEQVPVLTAKVDEQARKLEDQERAQLIAADKADPKGRKLTPATEAFWATQSLEAFKAFLEKAPHLIQMQSAESSQQQPAQASEGAAPSVLKHNGLAWEEMTSAQKHDLYFTDGGREIYEALKANHVERGKPRAQSQQQRASA